MPRSFNRIVNLRIEGEIYDNNSKAEDIINNYEGYMNKFSDTLTKSEQRLKEVDVRGAFNSDDEIGFFFTTVRSLQEQLNQFRINR